MARATMTDELARAAGQDAGNRSMRAAGRSVWNRADYNAAARVMNGLVTCSMTRADGQVVTVTIPQD